MKGYTAFELAELHAIDNAIIQLKLRKIQIENTKNLDGERVRILYSHLLSAKEALQVARDYLPPASAPRAYATVKLTMLQSALDSMEECK